MTLYTREQEGQVLNKVEDLLEYFSMPKRY